LPPTSRKSSGVGRFFRSGRAFSEKRRAFARGRPLFDEESQSFAPKRDFSATKGAPSSPKRRVFERKRQPFHPGMVLFVSVPFLFLEKKCPSFA
jgi:hypothetical protein